VLVGSGEGGGGGARRYRDGNPNDWCRHCHDHRKIKRLARRRGRVAQEAALGMVAGVHPLDVHDAGQRVAPRLMEDECVGDRDAETAGQEQDGEQHGANTAGHGRHDGNLRGWVSPHNQGAREWGLASAGMERRFNVDTWQIGGRADGQCRAGED
jgi:hypothetical protein